jgi:hypothetical protein
VTSAATREDNSTVPTVFPHLSLEYIGEPQSALVELSVGDRRGRFLDEQDPSVGFDDSSCQLSEGE